MELISYHCKIGMCSQNQIRNVIMGRRTHQKPGLRLWVVADKTKNHCTPAVSRSWKHTWLNISTVSKEADASLKQLSNIHQVQTQIQSHLFKSAHSSGQS